MGLIRKAATTLPQGAMGEIATVQKGEFLGQFASLEYPTLSAIRRNRAQGQGLRFYETMLLTDADIRGLLNRIYDAVLHYPTIVRAAEGPNPAYKVHAAFIDFATKQVPHLQNALRHKLSSYDRGFAVTEKVYEVVQRGEWTGAVIHVDLLDKPARWFTFDPERRLRFRTTSSYSPGELVPQQKFMVTTYGTNSDPFGDPILDAAYWPWRIRHQAFKNQAIYHDKWAIPTGKAKYQSSTDPVANEANRIKALRVLQAIQADSSIAYPEGMDLGLLESTRNGSISFETYLDQMWSIISRLITGQTLAGSGQKGGSYALGKVHAEAIANKVEMLATFVSRYYSRELRELVDINFGPQDAYPSFEILARDMLFKQAHLELEQVMMQNGHKVSVAFSDRVLQNVLPENAADTLTPPPATVPGQVLPVSPQLAAGDDEDPEETSRAARWQATVARARVGLQARGEAGAAEAQLVLLAAHRALHAHAAEKAKAIRGQLEKIGATATAQARPAITRAVKTIAKRMRGKKSPKGVTKAHLLKGLKGYDGAGLSGVFQTMLTGPSSVSFAASDQPPDISDAAKLALALQMLAIVDSVSRAAGDAPDGMTGSEFADSLTDPNGAAVDEAHANLFEGTHGTNIASIATAALRRKLDDPAYRKAYPYVMVVVTNPNARLGHRMLDGYVMSAEDARYSPFLPPFDFGCDCQVVPISAAKAVEMGLTGARPTGAVVDFMRAKGASPSPYGASSEYVGPNGERFNVGPPPGFAPAFASTDMYAQLQALRTKAAELARTDPDAWAALKNWLLWLFAFDVLTEDPPPEEAPNEEVAV